MSTTTLEKTKVPSGIDPRTLLRIAEEGYGPGAWHGPDFAAAIGDVTSEAAYWRPAAGRHNVAEVALHHAWCIRGVRAQLSGQPGGSFPLAGEDWFAVDGEADIAWARVQATVEEEQARLLATLATIADGSLASPLAEGERFDLVLGVTCHAAYHAGQVQLLKRLRG